MNPRPREISPELVLVDPELAALTRRHLPEPGSLARQHLMELEAGDPPVTAPAADGRAGNGRHGWGTVLGLTVGAVSLTLNGVWLAHALRPQESPPAGAAGMPVYTPKEWFAGTVTLASQGSPLRVPHTSTQKTTHKQTHHATHQATTRHRHTTARRGSSHAARRVHRRSQPATHVTVSKPATRVARQATKSLSWKAVASATYYDVVLWRNGKRVLDLWPTSSHVLLPTTSPHKHGPRVPLAPGRYLWFVYPGFGAKPAQRYGALAESGILVVQPKGG